MHTYYMEKEDVARYQNTAEASQMDERRQNYMISSLERYVETGEPQVFYIADAEQLGVFLDILGLNPIDGEQVTRIAYLSTAQTFLIAEDNPRFDGTLKLEQLFDFIADSYHHYVEFVNNYKAYVTLKLDDTTAMTFEVESDEQPGICESCCNDEQYMEEDADYNCGHGVDDTYSFRYGAMVFNASELDDHRPEEGHTLLF